jgi:EAL domain-containing protein (putative c-di-GMP-specific phosphodiesterase class I)
MGVNLSACQLQRPEIVDDVRDALRVSGLDRRLPLNILKIDKTFIDAVDGDDEETELTAAIVGLARVLDLRCVAEGVERPEQRDRLRS